MSDPLILASAQSAIGADVRENGRRIRAQMAEAHAHGAKLVHFPEGALSGYVKAQIGNWNAVDWQVVRDELEETAAQARQLGLWTIIGCNHRLSPPHLPHNSLYVISDSGTLVGRYDKRLCSASERQWYAPGREPLTFDVGGYRFGAALCIEIHFPHLFAEYEQLGVDCVLFSAYAEDPMFGITAQGHAGMNNFWLSIATPAQCSVGLPCGLIGPDGYYAARATADGQPAVSFGMLDRNAPQYDIALNRARPWRARARSGEAYRDLLVEDKRSADRMTF